MVVAHKSLGGRIGEGCLLCAMQLCKRGGALVCRAAPWLHGRTPRVRYRLKLFGAGASALHPIPVSVAAGSAFLGVRGSAGSGNRGVRARPGWHLRAPAAREGDALGWGSFSAASTMLFSLESRTEGAQRVFPFYSLFRSYIKN